MKEGAWPWTVNIAVNGPSVCAGVLVTKKWVLTAASCVRDASPNEIRIVAGIHSLGYINTIEECVTLQNLNYLWQNSFVFKKDL